VKVALRLLRLLGFGALGLFVLPELPRSVTLVYAVDGAPPRHPSGRYCP